MDAIVPAQKRLENEQSAQSFASQQRQGTEEMTGQHEWNDVWKKRIGS
ncbi:hypothetical protein [Rhizobium sp. FKY42]|nr:hypothetical protein [Rhizobium sp. FKY42]